MVKIICKVMIIATIALFSIMVFNRFSEALRIVPDDNKGNLEETIQKEEIEKKEIIKRQKSSYKENKSPQQDFKNEISPRTPIKEQETNQGKHSTFYILGGIFFLGVISVIVIFIRKLKS